MKHQTKGKGTANIFLWLALLFYIDGCAILVLGYFMGPAWMRRVVRMDEPKGAAMSQEK